MPPPRDPEILPSRTLFARERQKKNLRGQGVTQHFVYTLYGVTHTSVCLWGGVPNRNCKNRHGDGCGEAGGEVPPHIKRHGGMFEF